MKKIYVFMLLLLVFMLIWLCDAKGGRGGGSYSSSRGGFSSRSRSGGRYGGRSSSKYSRMSSKYNARGWTTRTKRIAFKAGAVYMTSRVHRNYYRTTSHDYDDEFYNMEICRNVKKYPPRNASDKIYGWFVCPTYGYDEGENYCCGSADNEVCCSFWKTSAGVGRIVGIVLGCFTAIVVIVIFIWTNPSCVEKLLVGCYEVICCPCKSFSKWLNRRRRRRRARRTERARNSIGNNGSVLEVDASQSGCAPPPPSYEACTGGLMRKEDDASCPDENDDTHIELSLHTSNDKLNSSNHCNEPSAPVARPPSPCSYRPPSPRTYRPPSPPTYRPPSPKGRSSPVSCSRHSFSHDDD